MRRYKEIFFGFGLGLAMWVVDAAMHTQLAAHVHPSGSFVVELFQPGTTQLIFRSFFLFVAVLFGWALWRSNWRERELQALERAIIAFHRQLDSPAMRIVSLVRMLGTQPGVTQNEAVRSIVAEINDNAHMIDSLTKSYIRFSEQVMAGHNREAIETLRAIEAQGQDKQVAAGAPPASW
jgi:hypothetical protein